MTTPNPRRPRGATARLAQLAAEQEAARRARDDELLAEADRLGDHAPALLREVAASIREHREAEARCVRHAGDAAHRDMQEKGR